MTDQMCQIAPRLQMQFHITGRCNLRCKHCYRQEGDVEPLSYQDVVEVMEQYKKLRLIFNEKNHTKRRGHINITGGEPFIREDIHEILAYMGQNRQEFSYGVLSNGSFIDPQTVQILKDTGVSFVQLSIDGNRKIHDSLRAKGDYDRVLKTAAYLEKQGIATHISFTANRQNYRYLPVVARACRRRGITKLWTDRLVPIGNAQQIEELVIDRQLLPKYLKMLKKAQGNSLVRKLYPKTQVTANRALQFLGAEGAVYSCSAGNTLITVDEFGNIMPCRRMPVLCGNVADTTLEQVYLEHPVFRALRSSGIPKACGSCAYAYICRGGAKCQACGAGDPEGADPACPNAIVL